MFLSMAVSVKIILKQIKIKSKTNKKVYLLNSCNSQTLTIPMKSRSITKYLDSITKRCQRLECLWFSWLHTLLIGTHASKGTRFINWHIHTKFLGVGTTYHNLLIRVSLIRFYLYYRIDNSKHILKGWKRQCCFCG